jgi:uncharacterized protein YegL
MGNFPIQPVNNQAPLGQHEQLNQLGNQLVRDTYSVQTTRATPTAIILLLDQSGSMSEGKFNINSEEMNKAQALSYYVNTLLEEITQKCKKDDGIRDYIDICILGYGANGNECSPAWIGALEGKTWVSVNELYTHGKVSTKTIRVMRRGIESDQTVETRTWINPVSKGSTPLGAALKKAYSLCDAWIRQGNHKTCYPPTVINFTDGEATDVSDLEQLLPLAQQITQLHTEDGHVLFYNCHLSIHSSQSCYFPKDIQELPKDKNAKTLYEMSSVIPPIGNAIISQHRKDADTFTRYKGMVFNAPITTILSILQLGTITI